MGEGTVDRFVIRADRGGNLQAHLAACNGCCQCKLREYLDEEYEVVRRTCRFEYPI